MRPAFTFMNDLGTAEALRLVKDYAAEHQGFVVPRCLEEHGATNKAFDIPVVLRQDHGDVCVLTIRRPKVLNALNQGVFAELQQRFEAADGDPNIRAIVLTGFGKKAFVSGADVNFLARIETREQGVATSRESQAALNAIEDTSKPTVCALNGLAFGGGNELAMCLNLRIAKKGVRVLVGQPEPNIGIIPGAGGTQRLPRLVGFEAATPILRTGRPISSTKALEIGLIAEEVEGDLLERAVALARDLADGKTPTPHIDRGPLANAPVTLPDVDIGHLSKKVDEIMCRTILEGAKLNLRDGIALEAECFGEVCATRDMRIGVTNFLDNGPRSPAQFVHA